MAKIMRVISGIRKQKYDLSIWPYPSATIKMENLSFLLGARIRILFQGKNLISRSRILNNYVLPDINGLHYVQKNRSILKLLGIEFDNHKHLIIELSEPDTNFAGRFLAKTLDDKSSIKVGFQPGGKVLFNYARQWAPDKFAKLADALAHLYGATIFLFGAKSEKQLIKSIANMVKTTPIVICDLSLGQVAAIINRLDLFIANDSALMHVATAVGTKTIGIFGPTDPRKTGPWGPQHRVVRLDLPCSPCYDRGFSLKCSNRRCLNELTVKLVMDEVAKIMRQST